jgi:twitching motility protein PilT
VPAVEVMVSTPTIQEYVLDPAKTPLIENIVAEGVTQYGMQSFDQSVLGLLQEGLITEEDALKNCNHPNELALKLKGILAASDRVWQPVDAVMENKTAPGDDLALAEGSRPAGSGKSGARAGLRSSR